MEPPREPTRLRPDGPTRPGGRSGLGSRRVVAVSFALALVVHVGVILLYPVVSALPQVEGSAFRLPPPAPMEGIEVVRIVEVPEPDLTEAPEEPEEVEEVEPAPIQVPEVSVPDEMPSDLPPPPPSGAERLRPRRTVPELWQPLPPEITAVPMEQREALELSLRIDALYDSLAAADEAQRRLTDWTFTDDQGRRWGFADGKIYLGDFSLPLPFSFGTNVGVRDEVNRRLWQWDEIQRQGARVEVQESLEERQRAIRERRDRERATTKPDTTRVRR